jgi:DNA-binding ferritin-like protein (Dps family)
MKILDKIFGENWREEKREYREFEARVKALPKDFEAAYKEIQKYAYNVGLVTNDWQIFVELLEVFELATLDGNSVETIVGHDVAGFADVFFDKENGQKSWLDKHRQALNDYFMKTGR